MKKKSLNPIKECIGCLDPKYQNELNEKDYSHDFHTADGH